MVGVNEAPASGRLDLVSQVRDMRPQCLSGVAQQDPAPITHGPVAVNRRGRAQPRISEDAGHAPLPTRSHGQPSPYAGASSGPVGGWSLQRSL